MNDFERFENELRSLKPAPPPPVLLQRLTELQPPAPAVRQTSRVSGVTGWDCGNLLRWLVPATALLATAGFVWLKFTHHRIHGGRPLAVTVPASIKADSVQIDEQLVGAFDAVGRLPNGEPVRFHCREWMDNVVLRDKTRGVVIEQRSPRVEVVPARFETY
jgi:hypothetical protein